MNAKGRILIIGVDKDGHIKDLADDYFSLGRKNREGFEKRFIEAMASKLGSDICSLAHLAFHEIGDMESGENCETFKQESIIVIRSSNS